jgi:hypothetical protein
MTIQTTDTTQTLEIPVSINGVLRVTVPPHLNAEEFRALALQRFSQMLETQVGMGESGEPTFGFAGDVWSTEGQSQVADLLFDVQHDLHLNVTGASVALRPKAGEFGANRYRSRLAAYVTEHDVYITGRNPQNDVERVLVSVRMDSAVPTVHVMNPADDDYVSTELAPLFSVPFPGMSSMLN